MLPLFKSHYSVGKSILTPAQIFEIAGANDLPEVILVEDSLVGFLEAQAEAKKANIRLVFGLRLSMCSKMSEPPAKYGVGEHKIIVFAKNGEGCLLLNKLYSLSQVEGQGRLDSAALESLYNEELIKIAIPFYDSFLFHNAFSYESGCLLDHSFFNPTFFLEDNLLPFDQALRSMVESYAEVFKFSTQEVKTIYYQSRSDFDAYQTYKCICNRTPGRSKTLDVPNLDHCGSPEFCFESYLDHESA